MKKRCHWANSHTLLEEYHDKEWGVPVHDDRLLFEMLNLEGAQAGLSWLTVLKKRDGYKKAFYNFDAKKITKMTATDQKKLMKFDGIVKNRLKINAVVENAKAYLEVKKEFGSFDKFIWQFKDQHDMSKVLKKRGFRFVGPTICYAFMQGVGMVNDHEKTCFRRKL